MATFLPNVTDVFPASTDFDPDFNRIERMLKLRENLYQQGAKRVKTLYDSLFNSEMLRDKNIQNRDAYLKTITNSLNRIASGDLSLMQNQQAANNLFTPILTDADIVKDIAYTRTYQKELSDAQNLKNSTDLETRKRYWTTGVKDLQYQAEEFKKADDKTALSMSSPKYVPQVDLQGMAEKLWKDSGISVKQDVVKGGYIWTMKNGEAVMPVAQSFVSTMFAQDPAISEMLRTEARVKRKDYIKENAAKFNGNEALAEQDYFKTVLDNEATQNKLLMEEENKEVGRLKTEVESWDNLNKKGKILKGSVDEKKYEEAKTKLKVIQNAFDQRRKNTLALQLSDEKDINQVRNVVDGNIALARTYDMSNKIASLLATKDAEVTAKVDQYSLADYKHNLNIRLEGIRQAGRQNMAAIQHQYRVNEEIIKQEGRIEAIDQRAKKSSNKKGEKPKDETLEDIKNRRKNSRNVNISDTTKKQNTAADLIRQKMIEDAQKAAKEKEKKEEKADNTSGVGIK